MPHPHPQRPRQLRCSWQHHWLLACRSVSRGSAPRSDGVARRALHPGTRVLRNSSEGEGGVFCCRERQELINLTDNNTRNAGEPPPPVQSNEGCGRVSLMSESTVVWRGAALGVRTGSLFDEALSRTSFLVVHRHAAALALSIWIRPPRARVPRKCGTAAGGAG